jgi:thiol-disulfide isomerase/thioredoxin
MKYTKLISILATTSFLFFVGCGGSSDTSESVTQNSTAQTQTSNTEQTTPSSTILDSTTLLTSSGKSIKLNRISNGLSVSGQEGKILLLEIYGTSCPHCIAAIDGYNRLKNKYPNDVYILTVDSYGQLDNAGLQNYAAEHGITYDTVAKANAGKTFEYVRELTGYVPQQGVPVLLIFGRDGSLVEYLPPQDLPETYVEGVIQSQL